MKTIGIAGLGVMGGSFAARLRELGYRVLGYDINPQSLQTALERNWIDEGTTNPKENLNQCDMVILCLYPHQILEWIETYGPHLKPGALVMEISGVKSALAHTMKEALGDHGELLCIHPMCGRESRGIQFASGSIFDRANFIIIPFENSSPKAIVQASSLAKELGCGQISVLDMDEHDDMIAFLSQLTHVIAVCLMNTHENEHLVEYTGDSFRDLTRIAKINEDMWAELFLLNKEKLLDEISQFEKSLDHFKQVLQQEDESEMKSLFIQSTNRRKRFDR